MRRSTATAGILLLLLGVFLFYQGGEVLTPLAESTGLASHQRTVRPLILPTLLTVPPLNYTWISTNLNRATEVAGSFHVGIGREIDFYVMDERGFYDWRAGQPATVLLAVLSTSLYNFTLTVGSQGTYYFLFENQESARRTVIFSLDTVRDEVIINPAIQYLPIGLIILGVVLLILGASTGKKARKPEREEMPPAGWKCGFCATQNPLDEAFCGNCGRSRQ